MFDHIIIDIVEKRWGYVELVGWYRLKLASSGSKVGVEEFVKFRVVGQWEGKLAESFENLVDGFDGGPTGKLVNVVLISFADVGQSLTCRQRSLSPRMDEQARLGEEARHSNRLASHMEPLQSHWHTTRGLQAEWQQPEARLPQGVVIPCLW